MVKIRLSNVSEADDLHGRVRLRGHPHLMSRYTSATDADRREMLDAIGVESIDALFDAVPEGVRLGRPLDLPPGKPEQEVYARLRDLAARNVSTEDEISFLGAGMYDHYVPSLIDSILSRSRVPDALHALPAGDLPGRAAGDVRVPDRDLASSPACRSPTRPSTRARARSPPPPTWRSCTTSARAS